jgi:alpha-tubulin suppressor-like RCC1 family protein
VSSTFTTATQLDAGVNHTCALAPGGAAFCWGGGRPAGQLGLGVLTEAFAPLPVNGNIAFTSISAGWYSSCGTSSAGMYCWGLMGGNGTVSTGSLAPKLVSSWNGYSRVSVGRIHACAYYNLGGYRTADCWGYNAQGQGGFNPAVASWLPFTVGTGTGTTVNNVTTQGEFTCVDQANTTVQCFGQNGSGMLGNGNFTQTHVAQTVGNGMALRGVSTSLNHACAIDPNGAGYCWGNGYHGQLGNSVQALSPSPVPVAMPYNIAFRAIAAGGKHTCAIGAPIRQRIVGSTSSNTAVYCWGDNSHGQLGRGILTPDGTPMTPLPTIAF